MIMFEQALFQFVNYLKSFLIFDKKLFIIFNDDRDNIINRDDT